MFFKLNSMQILHMSYSDEPPVMKWKCKGFEWRVATALIKWGL